MSAAPYFEGCYYANVSTSGTRTEWLGFIHILCHQRVIVGQARKCDNNDDTSTKVTGSC